jgi:hypothetical protein
MNSRTWIRHLAAAATTLIVAVAASPASALPASQEQWIDGTIAYTSGIDCIILGSPSSNFQELGAFTGYWGKPDATYPKIGDRYWGHVYVQPLGPGCALGIHGVQVEINLPAGTSLAINGSSSDPNDKLRCYGTNLSGQVSEVTGQTWTDPNTHSSGKYCQPTVTSVGAHGTTLSFSALAQGQALNIVFPLLSTKKLSGIAEPNNASQMTATVTDTASSTLAQPYQWNFVGDRPVEADCPAAGTTAASAITNTTAHTKNFMCNWYRAGKAQIDLGEGASGPYTASSQQYNVDPGFQGFYIDQDWNNLIPGTTYHYRLKFIDTKGNTNPGDDQTYLGPDKTFTTTGTRPTNPPATPPGTGNGGTGSGGSETSQSTGTTGGSQQQPQDQGSQGQQQQQQQQVDPPPPPPKDTTAPTVSAAVGKVKLGDVLKKGLPASVTCSEACNLNAVLQIDAKTAKKLKLGKKVTTIGKGFAMSSGGKTTVPVKLTAKAKKALKKLKSLKVTLIVNGTDSAGNAAKPVTKKLTLKR